jgi:MFS family permease
MAMVTVGGASYLTAISARGTMGLLAAFYALSMTIGGALGNPLAAVIITSHGYYAFSWFAIAISIVIILVVIFFMPSIQDKVLESWSFRSTMLGIQSTIRQTNVRLLIGLRCPPTIFYGMLVVLIPLEINNLSDSKGLVAGFGMISLIVASASQLLAGRVADRWGARLPTGVAYMAIILSGIGLMISSGTVWGLFVFGAGGIAAAWSLSTLMYVWINDGIPKAEHPATFGILHAVWSLSMIAGSVLGGWSDSLIAGLPFLVAGLLNVGSLFLISAYYRRVVIKDARFSG